MSERVVGIDLGTTNSLIGFMEGDTPVIIPGEDGSNLVPSVVALDEPAREPAYVGQRSSLLVARRAERRDVAVDAVAAQRHAGSVDELLRGDVSGHGRRLCGQLHANSGELRLPLNTALQTPAVTNSPTPRPSITPARTLR